MPLAARKLCFDKEGKPSGYQDVIADRDECNRPSTTLEDLAALKPVWKDGKWVQQGEFITAGNASQFSDGAAAVLLMSRAEARQRGIEALGTYRGITIAAAPADHTIHRPAATHHSHLGAHHNRAHHHHGSYFQPTPCHIVHW